MDKDIIEKRRIFVDNILQNDFTTTKDVSIKMEENGFSNGWEYDKHYIYHRIKTLGIKIVRSTIEPGTIFHDLTVISYVGKKNGRKYLYKLQCVCGNIIEREIGSFPKSCGCKRSYYTFISIKNKKSIIPRVTVYSKEGTELAKQYKSEYKIYGAMKQRCYNPKNNRYYLYGGRGIKVCDRWLENFKNFFDDMGPRPSNRHSIDRIDSDGMYEPTNCRWATYSEQNKNKSWEIYTCPHCKREIGQKSNFNKHIRLHENEEDIMRLYREGKFRTVIAKELSLNIHTVYKVIDMNK